MTDLLLQEYYSDLLILQFKGKPKAEATIKAVVKPIIIFELAEAVKNGYNIDTAIGVQLDVLGKYIGLRRALSDGEIVSDLSDAEYRNLLKFKIIKNFSNHSLKSIVDLMYQYFPTSIRVEEIELMYGKYIVYEDLTLAKIIRYNELYPKPMGVEIDIIASPYDPISNIVPFAYLGTTIGRGWGKLDDSTDVMGFLDGSTFGFSDGSSMALMNNVPADDLDSGRWTIALDK
jgi:hypothetical protein